LLDPAPDWDRPGDPSNLRQFLVLWHGCTSWDLDAIRSNPSVLIDPRAGREDTDFGQGFYTTSVRRQARHWAWKRYYGIPASDVGPPGIPLQPVVLRFRLKLEDIAPLDSLHFVLGDYDDERYWSLVQYCRQSIAGMPRTHLHPTRSDGWYDIVTGPVADFWRQRSTMRQADQVSFHTTNAVDFLNNLIRSGGTDDFHWEPV
jgi:hypothetical protein